MNNIRFKTINALAVPALISGISEPILSITDTAIVGNIPINATASLAAVGIVGTFLSMLIWVFGQIQSAISAIVSQYWGANKIEEVKNLPAQAIAIVVAIGVLVVLITYPIAAHIFKMYNAKDVILNYSVNYYKIRVFGFPFTLFTMAVYGTFKGLQNTSYPMRIAIIGVAINIVLDVILVYGIPNYIKPMHIEGAAYASLAAQIVMALMAAFYHVKKTDMLFLPRLPFNAEIPRLLGMVVNLFIRTLALNATLYFATRFATGYGKSYIAAYTMAINLWFLGAFIIDGYAGAGQILSGRLLGASAYDELEKLNKRLIRIGVILGMVLTLVGFVIYTPIGLLFTKAPEVLQEFYNVFWIVLLMQPLCAVAFILDGIFKGLGKMELLRNVLLAATFLVCIPIMYASDRLEMKLTGVFLALTFWMIARTVPLLVVFKRYLLKQKQA